MGVSLTDLITLAKAGYTPGQVKELISLDVKAETEAKAEEQQAAAGANNEPEPASAEPEKAPENGQPAPAQDPVDYRSLYEKAKADLDAAQKANINQNAGAQPTEDPEKSLREIVGTYL